LIIPGLAGVHEALAPRAYAFMRFCTAAIVVYHGYAKLFAGFAPVVAKNVLIPLGVPAPELVAYALGALEFFGGIALAIGLLTRPIALLFVIELAVVTYWHSGNGYFFSSPRGGWEYPLLLTLLNLGILVGGSGRCAVDRVIGREF
jgi:putative oxidoreductase